MAGTCRFYPGVGGHHHRQEQGSYREFLFHGLKDDVQIGLGVKKCCCERLSDMATCVKLADRALFSKKITTARGLQAWHPACYTACLTTLIIANGILISLLRAPHRHHTLSLLSLRRKMILSASENGSFLLVQLIVKQISVYGSLAYAYHIHKQFYRALLPRR